MFPQQHQDKFARLRAHFLSGLPAREAELEDLTATLLARGNCPETLEKLFIVTHKLAGICATYGLTAAGQQAALAESMIDRARGARLTETVLYEILLATDVLSDELRSIAGLE